MHLNRSSNQLKKSFCLISVAAASRNVPATDISAANMVLKPRMLSYILLNVLVVPRPSLSIVSSSSSRSIKVSLAGMSKNIRYSSFLHCKLLQENLSWQDMWLFKMTIRCRSHKKEYGK